MLLLPGAERERRALLLGAALAAGAGLSWWPLASVDDWIARHSEPVSGWLATGAGILAEWVLPEPAAAPPSAPPLRLEDLEGEAAAPPRVTGLAWLEVPVLRSQPGGSDLLLAAGRRHGLAEGMPVVWGHFFLGRISRLSETEALVLRPAAADERTGVRLQQENGEGLEAIAIGRGARLDPVLNWLEAGPEPTAGVPVHFRGRRSDPPALAAAGFLLGRLARRGEASRGDQAWVIEQARPEGAEGRVFVAAGALLPEPIAMPSPAKAPSRGVLACDAVLGNRLSAWQGTEDFAPRVLLRAERVMGPIVTSRGGLVWVREDRPEDWNGRAVVVQEASRRLTRAEDLPRGAAGLWFTRGGDGIPRGLWLGRSGDAPSRAGTATLLRAPGSQGDFP